MVRLDMSEYIENHAVDPFDRFTSGLRRIRRGRSLHRDAVRKKPYCVVLFDELENAHRMSSADCCKCWTMVA